MRRLVVVVALVGFGCTRKESGKPEPQDDAPPPWAAAPSAEPERPGMVWIPAGTLVAGTPPGRLPRIADQELPGERVELHGFFIDRFTHPGEQGAIPETGLTQNGARAMCEKQGKRLCTELEWERACKGPDNLTYEYGDEYDATVCGMDATNALAPNGHNTRCESRWGVRDLHGSAWTWTSSAWGRGTEDGKVVVRGGIGKDGALVGRCAHARAVSPGEREPSTGVRCCAGEVNGAAVTLEISRKSELVWQRPGDKLAAELVALAPEELRRPGKGRDGEALRIERSWLWRPVPNEELVAGAGCAKRRSGDLCGVVIARVDDTATRGLAWVSTDEWIATVTRPGSPRSLYFYGGDRFGAFRKLVTFDYGTISEARKERKRQGSWVRPFDGSSDAEP